MTAPALMTTRQHEATQFLRCYAFGHAWFEYDGSTWRPEWGVGYVLRCERCGSERRDSIDRTGQLSHRHYDKPEGYKYARGTKPSKDEFRLMLIDAQRQERKHKHDR